MQEPFNVSSAFKNHLICCLQMLSMWLSPMFCWVKGWGEWIRNLYVNLSCPTEMILYWNFKESWIDEKRNPQYRSPSPGQEHAQEPNQGQGHGKSFCSLERYSCNNRMEYDAYNDLKF